MLYKSTIVIWSEFDPRTVELSELARDAESGASICVRMEAAPIEHPADDPDQFDDSVAEFFFDEFDDCWDPSLAD